MIKNVSETAYFFAIKFLFVKSEGKVSLDLLWKSQMFSGLNECTE